MPPSPPLSSATTTGVILLVTLNAMVTLYAVLSVIGIVVSLLGLMVWGGFTLGVLESLCLSLMVGVSIDYTLHLAIGYMESAAELPRQVRVL